MSVQPVSNCRFVVLEHAVPPPVGPVVHWDFIVEVRGADHLPTWRLEANPLECPGPIPAERIQDHRRLYLEFEGELTGGRGCVRRIERGTAQLLHLSDDEAALVLAGAYLRGAYAIARTNAGLRFRRHDLPTT